MKTIGIIPSRYASTRFPGKPLVLINGKSMVQRVYEQASKATLLDEVIIATDDQRIADEVERFGGKYVFTSSKHQSGTDRCAEVIAKLPQFDTLVNIQGDEPFIDPVQIDLVASCFANGEVKLATLVKAITDQKELFNPNIPKVTLNKAGDAIYFSRQTIPFLRNTAPEGWLDAHQFYKHIGIYGYKRETLLEITQLVPSPLELAENLEQLRWLENGYQIKTAITTIETLAIDTPEDLEKLI